MVFVRISYWQTLSRQLEMDRAIVAIVRDWTCNMPLAKYKKLTLHTVEDI